MNIKDWINDDIPDQIVRDCRVLARNEVKKDFYEKCLISIKLHFSSLISCKNIKYDLSYE